MKKSVSRKLIGILLVLCTLLNILPVTQAEETAGIQPYAVTADIPSAKDIEHVHNSAGWQCYLTCDKEEHQHSIEGGCYNLICAKDETDSSLNW